MLRALSRGLTPYLFESQAVQPIANVRQLGAAGLRRPVVPSGRARISLSPASAAQWRRQWRWPVDPARRWNGGPTWRPAWSGRGTGTRRGFSGSRSRSQAQGTAPPEPEPQSMSARLKKLSREYGWTALGVYFGLSVLDFPFCFLLVRTVGTEKIAEAEHWVTSKVKLLIPEAVRQWWHDYKHATKEAKEVVVGDQKDAQPVEMVGWGVEEAERRNKVEASLATQLALAYAIHKSFIFVRIPLTAAILPKVVRVLRSWGWQIGKRPGKRPGN